MLELEAVSVALAAGAAEMIKGSASEMVKDTYKALKETIKTRYSGTKIDQLEQMPDSLPRRLAVEEELKAANAGDDPALERLAERLLTLIRPKLAAEVGSDIVKASTSSGSSQRVFIVHGHDDAAREAVARLVERAGLEAVILREQPNQGRTIIEKFEKQSETAEFAVVLLTPDDVGGARGTLSEKLRLRARQNVVAELFFFIGKLGRSRVCALVKGDVELPSDFAGVVYEQMDEAGHWRLALAREMMSAGLPVDLNKIFH